MDMKSAVSAVETDAKSGWGFVRRFIAAHPLTGAWVFCAVGAAFGWLVHAVV